MIDDKLLLGLLIGAIPSIMTLLANVINRRDTRESALVTALQAELDRKDREIERKEKQIAEWQRLWTELYVTGQEHAKRLPQSEASPS